MAIVVLQSVVLPGEDAGLEVLDHLGGHHEGILGPIRRVVLLVVVLDETTGVHGLGAMFLELDPEVGEHIIGRPSHGFFTPVSAKRFSRSKTAYGLVAASVEVERAGRSPKW